MTPDDEPFLRRAIELATEGRAGGDAPFGSLLVGSDGTVLAEDHNTVLSDDDISAHPELKLAKWAARELDATTAGATTMYTSCRPAAVADPSHRLGCQVGLLGGPRLDDAVDRINGGLE
jgi:tRNA(Arg) A34 adenosine deaminase TadA